MRFVAYVYPGWHPIPERDRSFHPGFTEWELVRNCRPRFAAHAQPRIPKLGEYDDRDPLAVERRIALAREHGIDGFVYGYFWCRGKRVFESALDEGYLRSATGRRSPFAVMWANRLPRRVLPVRRTDLPVIDEARRVPSDVDDFVRLIQSVAERYFRLDNYLRVDGRAYFSIFDSTFFVRELGERWARVAITRAREWLAQSGYPELHLAAIDPSAAVTPLLAGIGFDSVTHYVHLPRWRGPTLQDYDTEARARALEWDGFRERSGLPYCPSIAAGWDASPRGADFGERRPDKYPWSPVIQGEHPEHFYEALNRAVRWVLATAGAPGVTAPIDPLVFVASLNEWSEGHYLEPDERFGLGWLEAVRRAAEVAGRGPDVRLRPS